MFYSQIVEGLEGHLRIRVNKMDKLFIPPKIELKKVRVVMVSEALPVNKKDYFYSSLDSLYVRNTLGAFKSAGVKVKSIADVIEKGVYLTVAVKEPRKGLVVAPGIIERYSYLLEKELKTFPNTRVILLMGDAAIKAMNFISQRINGRRVIPAVSTYKIRKEKFYFGEIRVFPSYLQTGKNFLIEKAKQRMVAEDIKNAFKFLRGKN